MDIVQRPVPPAAVALAAAGIHPVLARVFAARGVTAAAELDADLARLPPFASMKGIDAAAARLADAIARGEKVLIVADYDADGATACAVGIRGLKALGAVVDFIVPNRFEYGYGLTPEIVAEAATRSPRLIVTVDNGIASHDGVAAAAALGIEVLITDHHLPAATLPHPALIVNPNQPGCEFPGKHLAGVGVMFYVLLATRALLRERGAFAARAEPNLGALLDLVALGTVADVVRLDRINRTWSRRDSRASAPGARNRGSRRSSRSPGATRAARPPTTSASSPGPRLNAAGRLADMTLGIRCLLADTGIAALAARGRARPPQPRAARRRSRDAGGCAEALAGRDFDDRRRRRVHALPVRRRLAPGRGRHRRVAPQGPLPPADDRLRAGQRGRAQGIGALDPGLSPARRARPRRQARAGADREIRWARLCSRPVARRGGPAALRRRRSRRWRGSSSRPRSCAHARDRRRPRARRADFALAAALRTEVWGQGFPAPHFEGIFEVADQRTVGAKHSKLMLLRQGSGRPRASAPSCSTASIRFRPVSGPSTGRKSTNGTATRRWSSSSSTGKSAEVHLRKRGRAASGAVHLHEPTDGAQHIGGRNYNPLFNH